MIKFEKDELSPTTDRVTATTTCVQRGFTGYIPGDIMSLDGSRDMEATTCGIITKYHGRLVVYYGQDAIGRDCFDEINDVVRAGFLYEGNIYKTPQLKSELGI